MQSVLQKLGLTDDNTGVFDGGWHGMGAVIESVSPIDGKVIGIVRQASEEDFEHAMIRAQEAFEKWRVTPAPVRGETIRHLRHGGGRTPHDMRHVGGRGRRTRLGQILRLDQAADAGFAAAPVAECGRAFEAWRHVYNNERPHQALELETPTSRYTASLRPFPERLPPIDYGPGALVRKVQNHGRIWFKGGIFEIGRAFTGQPVALRPTTVDGQYDVFYCLDKVAEIDLKKVLS